MAMETHTVSCFSFDTEFWNLETDINTEPGP